jgi:hypothetical protein
MDEHEAPPPVTELELPDSEEVEQPTGPDGTDSESEQPPLDEREADQE